jgi:hypothetical protein
MKTRLIGVGFSRDQKIKTRQFAQGNYGQKPKHMASQGKQRNLTNQRH